jgi:hypothetical protein
LPETESPEWGALLKAEMQRRGWLGALHFWESGSWDIVIYDSTREITDSSGDTENAALMAAVLAILEGGNDVTSI